MLVRLPAPPFIKKRADKALFFSYLLFKIHCCELSGLNFKILTDFISDTIHSVKSACVTSTGQFVGKYYNS